MWILVEHFDGEIEEATLEVLSEARRLANKAKLRVTAVVLGDAATEFADLLSRHGADRILAVEHPLLKEYTADGYTTALAELIAGEAPAAFLLAGTALGRDLAPRLATRLKSCLVSDCVVLDIDESGGLEMTRPTCGGRVYTTFKGGGTRPAIVTVRPGVLGVGKQLKGRKAALESHRVELRPELIRTRVLSRGKVEREKLDITEAEVVLAFGRGMGDAAPLPHLEELARLIGASLGGSRAAVDERWLPFERQIGQTGRTIAPKVLVCCGISGAQQFSMGMRDSRFIVAINNDRNAPIFKVADVSVLGDLREVIPELNERLRACLEPGPDAAASEGRMVT